jgi:hypothetical protein
VIIALIIAVLAIVGLFVVMFGFRIGGTSVSKSAKTAFNKYANYYLYGEESDKALGEYDETASYKLYELEDANEKEKKSFFENASSLLGTFENSLDNGAKSSIENDLNNYKQDFELTKLIYVSPGLDNHEFIEKYMNGDKDELNEWIEKRFKVYKDSEYEKVRKYGENGVKYYDLYKQYMDESRASGCLDDESKCDDFSDVTLETKMQDMWIIMAGFQSDALENTISGCFTMSKTIDGSNDKNTGSGE